LFKTRRRRACGDNNVIQSTLFAIAILRGKHDVLV